MKSCWMVPKHAPVFVLLGRFGDIIQMLPCFRAIYERTGHKPVVIASTDYVSVLEGVTYVTPYPVRLHWYMGVPKARELAEQQYGVGTVLQWWNDDKKHAELLEAATSGPLVLQCHGNEWGVDINRWPDYGTSMADRAGFGREEWLRLPLVFDNRDYEREATLLRRVMSTDKRPMLLVNMKGQSSPFPFAAEVMNALLIRFKRICNIVDLSKVTAVRLYDLLALYDRAIGLITTDTSTLHLAPASAVPYTAFTVGGWTQSVPKGNCQLHITYNDVIARINDVASTVKGWINRNNTGTADVNSARLESLFA